MNILLALLCISFVKDSLGHGAHIYPYPWHVSNWDDCKARDPEIQNPWWIHFENMVPMPHYTNPFQDIEICEWPENCKFHMGRYEWGSTGVYVKEITQVEEMYDDKQGVRPKWTKYNPWSAPGHAYAPCNDGCGINGLNPGGCNNQAFENLEDYCPNVDITKMLYGKCCSSGSDCPHYEGGASAMRFWGNGDYTFENTPITKWTQGEPALVEWMISADHRGGYAYRLCKVPEYGISGIKEDCFENGHLNFAKTPMSSVFHLPQGEQLGKYWDNKVGSWIERPITTTRIGTKPDNSEWAKIDLPGLYKMVDGKIIDVSRSDYSDKIPKNGDYKFKWECDDECQKKMEEDGVKDGLHGKWAFKDYVEIPADRFPPGKYVLSFRWDSQRQPQIWNSCATVEIVAK